jgi:hypothetical protein
VAVPFVERCRVAEIDYAILAEYGRVDPAGLVTVVGASFDRLTLGSIPGAVQLSIVVRVIGERGEGDISIRIDVYGPTDDLLVGARATLSEPAQANLFAGRFAVAGAYSFPIPFQASGGHTVKVWIDEPGSPGRTILFEVVQAQDGEANTV